MPFQPFPPGKAGGPLLIGKPGPTGPTGPIGPQGPPGPGTGAGAWQPTTAYTAAQVVQAPDGSMIRRTADGTSRASFDATEQAAWTAVLASAGTVENDALTATYEAKLKPVTVATSTYTASPGDLVLMNQSGLGVVTLPLAPPIGTKVGVRRGNGSLTISASGSELIAGQGSFGLAGLSFPLVTLTYISPGTWAVTETSGPMPFGISIGAQGGYNISSSQKAAPYNIQGGDKVLYATPLATTVAAASAGLDVATLTGSGTLQLAAAVPIPFEYAGSPVQTGYLVVQTSAAFACLTFTGSSGGTLTGVSLLFGSGTLATGSPAFACFTHGIDGLGNQANMVTFIKNTGATPLPVVMAAGCSLNGLTNAIHWIAPGDGAYLQLTNATSGAMTAYTIAERRIRPSRGDRFVSGLWYPRIPALGTATSLPIGTAYATQLAVGFTAGWKAIGTAVTVAASSGGVLRFGIYADLNGTPGALVADLGTADATVTGSVAVTIPFTLPQAVYWLVAVAQGSSTGPTVAMVSQNMPESQVGSGSPGTASLTGCSATGVTGALPTTFPTLTRINQPVAVQIQAA